MAEYSLENQRASTDGMIGFLNNSIMIENIDAKFSVQKYDNLKLQQNLNFLMGLVARSSTEELLTLIHTSVIAYARYRGDYQFGGNGIRAVRISGNNCLILIEYQILS